MPAEMVERYQILNELGRGAISRVYAARDRSSGAVIALKTLDPALLSEGDANLAELFIQNARSAARLKHRSIVKVLDAGEAGGTAYVAMELVVGESVRQALDKRPLSIARAIQILDDIASALAYAHEEGIVHRGVKPSNIIVLRSGAAKIGDFGIGQIGEAALRYKSPEQVRGDAVDHRSDLFSLGSVLYEMLTRRALFQGESPKEITENILRAEAPAPSELNPHVPAALDRVISAMLARNPAERVADARAVLRELQGLKEAFGLGPAATARTAQPNASAPAAKSEPTLRASPPPRVRPEPRLEPEASEIQEPSFMMDRAPVPERASGSRAGSYAAGALVAAAVLGVAVFLFYWPAPSEPRAAASRTEVPPPAVKPPAPVAEASKEPSALPAPVEAKPEQAALAIASAPEPSPPEPLKVEPSPPPEPEKQTTKQPAATISKSPLAETEKRTAKQPPATISKSWSDGTAKLILAVSPQGEIYIDGKHFGTTPPITTLDLPPGMHRIEIVSGSRKPYLTYMTLQAGEQRRIRHDFGAKRSAPPT